MGSTKVVSLRYAGQCESGTEIAKGQMAAWDRSERKVICLLCLELAPSDGVVDLIVEPEFREDRCSANTSGVWPSVKRGL